MPWQPAPVLYPDAELVVINHLRDALPPWVQYVGRNVPATRRNVMVTVDRDGGSVLNLRDRARLRIRCWDLTDQRAGDLARTVVALFPTFVDGDPIVHVEHISGPFEVVEESPHKVRYLGFEIHTRGGQS